VEKILFVDDVQAILEGYKRVLHNEFQVDVALGGEEGLRTIAQRGPFAVVISDMRMPGMNGVEFLSAVKSRAPESVRTP
jgi:DNA-binding NtrC family response regulator